MPPGWLAFFAIGVPRSVPRATPHTPPPAYAARAGTTGHCRAGQVRVRANQAMGVVASREQDRFHPPQDLGGHELSQALTERRAEFPIPLWKSAQVVGGESAIRLVDFTLELAYGIVAVLLDEPSTCEAFEVEAFEVRERLAGLSLRVQRWSLSLDDPRRKGKCGVGQCRGRCRNKETPRCRGGCRGVCTPKLWTIGGPAR
jgi:hypothetical protein